MHKSKKRHPSKLSALMIILSIFPLYKSYSTVVFLKQQDNHKTNKPFIHKIHKLQFDSPHSKKVGKIDLIRFCDFHLLFIEFG